MAETREFSKSELRRMTNILGSGCASHKALCEIERREAGGEDVRCYLYGDMFLVGPALPAPTDKE